MTEQERTELQEAWSALDTATTRLICTRLLTAHANANLVVAAQFRLAAIIGHLTLPDRTDIATEITQP
jgi:ABC-type transport system involved in Fe-S cluster assembly fused permease/ATPase subunit